ncbi:MAG: beta-galactosidase, partial [Sphingobacteriales bacterium]|nr:beta-galactosidase [Sphingobacteriales bacterium]
MKRKLFFILLPVVIAITATAQVKHTFRFNEQKFLLDGKPFRIISGEMHPARIPHQYWRHRIQMAKAMGCNTIAAYIFWNYHENTPGNFDFSTDNKNISEFLKICKEENLWVILRPGPYVCAEWDLGGNTDVNGDYRGTDLKVHHAENFTNYSVFSFWDTHRALHPLMNMINKKRTGDWINTFLAQYKYGGMLPVWELSGNETFCMIGYHSVPVIVDAYQKG